MSVSMDDEIKRWTAKRKTALVMDIIQGKTTVAEASRAFDLTPSEIEGWVEDARKGMENALRANPLDIREQYERHLKELQEAYGEAMLELRARKKCQACWMERSKADRATVSSDQAEHMIRTIQEGLLADGLKVSIAKLCS